MDSGQPGYQNAHRRVRRVRGTPRHCERCGDSDGPPRHYEWANQTGRYDDPADYVRLCVPCHRRQDRVSYLGHERPDLAERNRRPRPDVCERNRVVRHGHFPYEDREWLRGRYEDARLSLRQVAAEADCSLRTIARWMQIHEIPRRPATR